MVWLNNSMRFTRLWEQVAENTIAKIEQYLSQIQQAGYVLVAHQTSEDTAMNIIQSQGLGAAAGLDGTALYSSSSRLAELVRRLMKAFQARNAGDAEGWRQNAYGLSHRGSDAVVIAAVPKQVAGNRLSDLDGYLSDLVYQGRLQTLQVPNQYIVGYWNLKTGEFKANGKFKPDGTL